jgi:phenylpyruvate tautomerase PptA (4-oxalocrotonate tautomerase family)
MAQVKIYGERAHLARVRTALSDAIQGCLVDALGLPASKRFQRFIALDAADFIHPPDRSAAYTIIEISMFAGRSADSKRRLLELLMTRIAEHAGIAAQDLEITLFETPPANWGIRGQTGDRLTLPYRIEV